MGTIIIIIRVILGRLKSNMNSNGKEALVCA